MFRDLSDPAKRALEGLQAGLPDTEWEAVSCWLCTFFRYQLEWLLDWSRFAILLKSRQIGASHTYAAAAVLWGMCGETTTVISVGDREAGEVLEKAKLHAAALRDLGSRWAEPVSANSEELVLGSGGRVVALPATSGGRSYSGNVLLDEFAYHANAKKVWDGAAAVVMHGYRLRVMSTPNGKLAPSGEVNLFFELWTSDVAHRGYRLHRVTLPEAQQDGLSVDVEECWKMARGSRAAYNQLFLCVFDVVEGALWSQELIDAHRVLALPEDVVRGVVAVDPATKSKEGSDETGIVGVAQSAPRKNKKGVPEPHFYVFVDVSGVYGPLAWARATVAVYNDWDLDRIVAEENNGGELVEANLRAVFRDAPYEAVWASDGKRTRAEPVAALYERGLVHHVGRHDRLEGEQTTWQPLTGMRSPNRMDALVWAVSYLAFAPVKRGGRRRTVAALSLAR